MNPVADPVDHVEDVYLPQLPPRTTVLVSTRHSVYRIVVTEGANVYLQGGPFFPDSISAHVDGASLGGALLKAGWISVGLVMEIRIGGKRIVTSTVSAIAIERPAQDRLEQTT